MVTESKATTDEQTQTLFFDGVLEALKAAAPEGSSVRVVGFDNADLILRAGYRVTDGDADVCIACGGEDEFAYARSTVHKKLILLPAREHYAAACHVYRKEAGAYARLCTGKKPFAVVFDPAHMHDNLASLFGEIVSLDLSVFDAQFGARLDGRRINGNAASEIAKLITELTDELKPLEKNISAQKTALISAGRRAAKIVADAPEILHASGAAQATEAYRMLCVAEERETCLRGEAEMLLGAYVTDFYIKSLTDNKLDFPPDNNKRLDSVCTNLGADLRRACLNITPIYPPQKLRLCEYRVSEFRTELLRMLTEIVKRRHAAWQVFKRLYPDDGYCLKTLIDKTDAPLCVALAPDVFKSNSLLSFLKQAGKLERYVV